MKYTVQAARPEHFSWLVQRTSVELSANFRAIEALDDIPGFCQRCGQVHGCIRGMVGYNGWTESGVSMHVAIETPGALKAIIRPAFEYPFIEGGKQYVMGITPGDNAKALKFNKHVGFRETYRVKDGWSKGVDLVLQEMRREDCRWIRD